MAHVHLVDRIKYLEETIGNVQETVLNADLATEKYMNSGFTLADGLMLKEIRDQLLL